MIAAADDVSYRMFWSNITGTFIRTTGTAIGTGQETQLLLWVKMFVQVVLLMFAIIISIGILAQSSMKTGFYPGKKNCTNCILTESQLVFLFNLTTTGVLQSTMISKHGVSTIAASTTTISTTILLNSGFMLSWLFNYLSI